MRVSLNWREQHRGAVDGDSHGASIVMLISAIFSNVGMRTRPCGAHWRHCLYRKLSTFIEAKSEDNTGAAPCATREHN